MAKDKKLNSKGELSRKERRKLENNLNENILTNEFDETEEMDNDFFVEDGDENDYRNLDDDMDEDELQGSDLDYDDEEDQLDSEGDKEKEEDEKDNVFRITAEKFKNLKNKALKGSAYHINQCVVVFSKAINLSDDAIEDDNEEADEQSQKKSVNILTTKKGCLKVIKFSLKDIPELLQLKFSKAIIKRFLGVLVKFLKNGDNWDESLICYAFKHLVNHVNLVKIFKSYTQILTKLAVKYWLELSYESSAFCLAFLREVAVSGEFDHVLKSCYLGYLSVAKAMNKSSYTKVNLLMDNILYLVAEADEDVGYKNVFLFLRKISMELHKTINDKKWNSIRLIYNWQFINSLALWTKLVVSCYEKKVGKSFELLTYPLIQLIVGVIRLHQVANFIPLRLNLIKMLNDISKASGIFIPVTNYLMEMVGSSIFNKHYTDSIKASDRIKRREIDLSKLIGRARKKAKLRLKEAKMKESQKQEGKHFLAKTDANTEFKGIYLSVSLKIKEFKSFDIAKELLEVVLNTLIDSCAINSHRLCFPELQFPIISNLKKIGKAMYHNEFKRLIKKAIDLLGDNSEYILSTRNDIKPFDIKKIGLIRAIEKRLKKSKLPLKVEVRRRKKLESQISEAEEAKETGEFLDI